MAPATSRLLPIALAPMVGLPVVAAETARLQWHSEVAELDFGALSDLEVYTLSSAYAQEVAAALGVEIKDVFDMTGRSSLVTLTAPDPQEEDAGSDVESATTTSEVITSKATRITTSSQTTKRQTTTRPNTTSILPPPTHAPVSTQAPAQLSKSLFPLRGVSYGPLPCTQRECRLGLPSTDMVQVGYQAQWGAEGRDDLGVMARLGANAVRLYHSLGLRVNKDHGAFLDYAGSQGLKVLPGYHTDLAIDPAACPDFDCYDTWKEATLQGFQYGYKQGNKWHSAIGGLVLLNEPDVFESQPKCAGRGSLCHLKASLSALDGVLAAEREVGLTSTENVKLTVAWSFALKTSIDGKVSGPAVFGFQDIVAGIKDPQLASYTPRSSLEDLSEAFRTRWVHSLNTQAPWSFVSELVGQEYEQFLPTPWFIAEYGANKQPEWTIRQDLQAMENEAKEGGAFKGVSFFQFQTAYFKGDAGRNFGLFELTGNQVLQTSRICDDRVRSTCRTWPVRCLSPDLSFLPGSLGRRADAVAAAWGGIVDVSSSVCRNKRRLTKTQPVSTKLACDVHLGTASPTTSLTAISGDDLARRLVSRTLAELGTDSSAVKGKLHLTSRSVVVQEGRGEGAPGWLYVLAIVVAAFFGVASTLIVRGIQKRSKIAEVTSKDSASGPSGV